MRTLKDLTTFVEQEAADEGPAALAALQAERDRFRIARELAEARKAMKLTQVQLSKRAGVPQAEISKIESGKANATELTLFRVAHAMGYSFRLEPLAKKSTASKPTPRPAPAKKSRGVGKRPSSQRLGSPNARPRKRRESASVS